jgi:hypothetical protein
LKVTNAAAWSGVLDLTVQRDGESERTVFLTFRRLI